METAIEFYQEWIKLNNPFYPNDMRWDSNTVVQMMKPFDENFPIFFGEWQKHNNPFYPSEMRWDKSTIIPMLLEYDDLNRKETFKVMYDDQLMDVVDRISEHLKPFGLTIEIGIGGDGFENYDVRKINKYKIK